MEQKEILSKIFDGVGKNNDALTNLGTIVSNINIELRGIHTDIGEIKQELANNKIEHKEFTEDSIRMDERMIFQNKTIQGIRVELKENEDKVSKNIDTVYTTLRKESKEAIQNYHTKITARMAVGILLGILSLGATAVNIVMKSIIDKSLSDSKNIKINEKGINNCFAEAAIAGGPLKK